MSFNALEQKALVGLALLYATRMLGLFMVLPILTLYGMDLEGATSISLGLALGIYGITQAILQIPFGAASDRFGRKPLIVIGLLIFFLGSLVSALSDNVIGLIIGRALQGGGAISSVVLALLADYTREQERSKAMAVVGAVIGSSFVLAVMIGPVITGWFGLSGLFWFTSSLALMGLLVVLLLPDVPPLQIHSERKVRRDQFRAIFNDANVLILSLGVFILHLIMTALFVALPVLLVARGFAAENLGSVYAPVMILAFIGMAPMMMASERRKAHVLFLRLAALIALVALVIINFVSGGFATAIALLLFFVGFNFMEASLPSLLSRKVSASQRGTAMGLFATSQFTGAAVGGIVGGVLFSDSNITPVVILGAALLLIWIAVLAKVEPLKSPMAIDR